MRLSLKLVIALEVLAFATSAFATNIYLTYSGSGFTGSGVFTASDQGGGTYLVTGVNGQQNTIPFSGVEPVSPQLGGWQYNNLVYLSSDPQLDVNGVLLDWNGGQVNLGYQNGGYVLWNNATGSTGLPIDFAATTPEPSTLLIMGSGLIGLAGLARKRLCK